MSKNLPNEPHVDPTSLFLEERDYHRRSALLWMCSAIVVGLAALVMGLVAVLVVKQSFASALQMTIAIAPLGALFTFLVHRHSHHCTRATEQQNLVAAWIMWRVDDKGMLPITQAYITLGQANAEQQPTTMTPSSLHQLALGAQNAMKHISSKPP